MNLCWSAAEYACPVWARSIHANKLNPSLPDCCRIITGYRKPANVTSIHLLAGMAPPHSMRTVARTDDSNQPPTLRPCIICSPIEIAEQLHTRSDTARFIAKIHYTADVQQPTNICASYHQIGAESAVYLPAGSEQPLPRWRSMNRLCTGVYRAKTMMMRWGNIENTQSINCDCGEPQTMAHLLCCRLLDKPCSSE